MLRALSFLLALGLASCGPEAASPETPGRIDDAPAPETTSVSRSTPEPPTPFDAADTAFDSIEPPEQIVQIPPRPAPPTPRPTPPPPPASGPAGSCDVRATEGYCLAFAGRGWTPGEARAVCDEAPDATFGPGACPLANRVATCAFEQPSSPGQEIVYTYYAPHDLGLAELACPGRFTRIE